MIVVKWALIVLASAVMIAVLIGLGWRFISEISRFIDDDKEKTD